MILPIVKFQSGQVVSLAAFLLKLPLPRRRTGAENCYHRERPGVMDAESLFNNQQEESHERRSF